MQGKEGSEVGCIDGGMLPMSSVFNLCHLITSSDRKKISLGQESRKCFIKEKKVILITLK